MKVTVSKTPAESEDAFWAKANRQEEYAEIRLTTSPTKPRTVQLCNGLSSRVSNSKDSLPWEMLYLSITVLGMGTGSAANSLKAMPKESRSIRARSCVGGSAPLASG